MDEVKTNKKNKLYLLIGIIVGVALVIVISSIIFLNKSYRNNVFVGTWDCKGVGKTAKGVNYIYTFKFDNNGKFIFGEYAELDKESFKGTYEIKEQDKKDAYTISFNFENRKNPMDVNATLGKENDKTTATMIDEDDSKIICYLQTSKNPNLK